MQKRRAVQAQQEPPVEEVCEAEAHQEAEVHPVVEVHSVVIVEVEEDQGVDSVIVEEEVDREVVSVVIEVVEVDSRVGVEVDTRVWAGGCCSLLSAGYVYLSSRFRSARAAETASS